MWILSFGNLYVVYRVKLIIHLHDAIFSQNNYNNYNYSVIIAIMIALNIFDTASMDFLISHMVGYKYMYVPYNICM